QGVSVTPNAQTYELTYIQREIAGTRAAYGLSDVGVRNFTGDQPLTAQDVQNDQATVNNLRLWDYVALKETYQQQQTIRTYYTFNDIDIDRYMINGQYQQLEISAREMDTSKLSSAVAVCVPEVDVHPVLCGGRELRGVHLSRADLELLVLAVDHVAVDVDVVEGVVRADRLLLLIRLLQRDVVPQPQVVDRRLIVL